MIKFKKLKELFYSIKVKKETEKAILFIVQKQKNGSNFESWIPKDCLGFEKKKPTLITESFNPILSEIVEQEEIKKPKLSSELPPYFDVYNNAVKKGLDVQRIGSHLILKIDKESTKLKDRFVESGGERNYNTFAQGDGDYYIFYAQFKPHFENLTKNKSEK